MFVTTFHPIAKTASKVSYITQIAHYTTAPIVHPLTTYTTWVEIPPTSLLHAARSQTPLYDTGAHSPLLIITFVLQTFTLDSIPSLYLLNFYCIFQPAGNQNQIVCIQHFQGNSVLKYVDNVLMTIIKSKELNTDHWCTYTRNYFQYHLLLHSFLNHRIVSLSSAIHFLVAIRLSL